MKIVFNIKIILLTWLILCLTSCGTRSFIHVGSLSNLSKGMERQRVIKLFPNNPAHTIRYVTTDVTYVIDVYTLDRGSNFRDYYLTYAENEKLYYWGDHAEYSNHRNSFLNGIGDYARMRWHEEKGKRRIREQVVHDDD